jgi:transposase
MNERKYRTYPEAFKLEALALLKSSDKGAGQLEKELGITPGLLMKWHRRYQVVQPAAAPPKLAPSDVEAVKAENRRLQRQLAEVTEEREILKKALNIFSRPSS